MVSDADLRQLDKKSRKRRKENVKDYKRKYYARLRNEDSDEVKRKQIKWKSESREKMKNEDPEAVREKEK